MSEIFWTDPVAFEKHTAETYNYKFNFTDYLPDSATIASAAVTAYDLSTSEAVTSVLSGSATVTDSSLKVRQLIQGGSAGKTYVLRCTATLSTSEVLVLCTKMYVADELM